jgi:hypothetical protein
MKTIERLIRNSTTEVGMWKPTHYTSLRQARQLNPGEYANHFRIAKKLTVTVPEGWAVRDIKTGKPADVIVKYVPASPMVRQYEGQAHHMNKAADSLVTILCGLDYSKFGVEDAAALTAKIHLLINQISYRLDSEWKSR